VVACGASMGCGASKADDPRDGLGQPLPKKGAPPAISLPAPADSETAKLTPRLLISPKAEEAKTDVSRFLLWDRGYDEQFYHPLQLYYELGLPDCKRKRAGPVPWAQLLKNSASASA
jgi:hypothetical protein